MVDTIPCEIINHISSFVSNHDHGSLIMSTSWIYDACHDETKRKYVMKKGVNYFCQNGDLDMVTHCHRIGMKFARHNMDYAGLNGYFELIKWLHENRTEGCTAYAMDWAAKNGHLEMVKWLHENRTEGCTTNAMCWAAGNGHLEVVKWLHENRTEGCASWAMNLASKNGHLEMVKWLHENRTEGCTKWAMDFAEAYGHLEIVNFLETIL
jgi:hypothetical protein